VDEETKKAIEELKKQAAEDKAALEKQIAEQQETIKKLSEKKPETNTNTDTDTDADADADTDIKIEVDETEVRKKETEEIQKIVEAKLKHKETITRIKNDEFLSSVLKTRNENWETEYDNDRLESAIADIEETSRQMKPKADTAPKQSEAEAAAAYEKWYEENMVGRRY